MRFIGAISIGVLLLFISIKLGFFHICFPLMAVGATLGIVTLYAKKAVGELKHLSIMIGVYNLLAVNFAFIYYFLPENSFNTSLKNQFIDSLYFSYITLITIGFGDNYPIALWSKMLVILEGIIGLCVVAIGITSALSIKNGGDPKKAA